MSNHLRHAINLYKEEKEHGKSVPIKVQKKTLEQGAKICPFNDESDKHGHKAQAD